MAWKQALNRSARHESDKLSDVAEDESPVPRTDSKRDSNNGLDATSAADRFATLKEKLKLVRVNSKKGMNRIGSNRISDLVEEARLNRSAVVDDCSISANELKNQMLPAASQKRATHYREIQEYGRKIPIPLPIDLLPMPRLAAWHCCIRQLELMELSDGQVILSKGQEGRYVFFLLTGGTIVEGEKGDHLPLSILGEEALAGIPYTSTITAKAGKGQSCYFARLSIAAYAEALKEAEACRNSRSIQLRSLLLTSRGERTPINVRDLAAQLSIIEVFRTMEPEVRVDLCSFIEALSVPQGATLFKEGDKICYCYVILQGSVTFTKVNPDTGMSEEIGIKLAGEHFGTLATLANADKRRAFTATARENCSFAIISRVGYSRITRNQIQNDMSARSDLIRAMNLLSGGSKFDNIEQAINRIAFNSSREDFPSGHVLVNPSCYQNRVYIIMEGSCRLVWLTEDPLNPPPLPMSPEQHVAIYHPGQAVKKSNQADRDRDTSPGRSKSPRGEGKGRGKRESQGYNDREGSKTLDDDDIAQQMGSMVGARTCGCGTTLSSFITTSSLNPSTNSRGKQLSFDLAHLGPGDLVNGDVLLGMAPALSVIATSSLKVMAMEVDAVESNPTFCAALQSMVRQQWDLNSKRLRNTAAVRSALKAGSSAYHRNIEDDRELQSKFLDHYIPHQKHSDAASPDPRTSQGVTLDSSPKAQTPPPSLHQQFETLQRPQASSSLGFNEICNVSLSTIRSRPSVDGSTRHDAKKMQAKSAMAILQNASATGKARGAESSQGKVWRRAPNSLAPSTFAGQMHPLIGDLMGNESNSNPGDPRPQITSSLDHLSEARDHNEDVMQVRLPDPTSSYHQPPKISDGSSDAASSPPPRSSSQAAPYRPQFTLPNAYAKSRSPSPMLSAGNPMIDSPVLMSKVARLQPVNSRATAVFASNREAAILSVGRLQGDDPLSLPSLGAAPSTPQQGALRNGEDVAILPHHMSSYAALVPLRDSSPSPFNSPKKAARSKLGLPPTTKQDHGHLSNSLMTGLPSTTAAVLQETLFRQCSVASFGSYAGSMAGSVAGGWEEKSVNKLKNPSGIGFERLSSKRDMMNFGYYSDPQAAAAEKSQHSMSRMGTNQRASLRANGSVRDQPGGASFKVRSIKAWRRPDEDLDLPLDRDALAPSLKDHAVSNPSAADINYILRRWDNQWESDRQEARRKLEEDKQVRSRAGKGISLGDDYEDNEDAGGGALWDLDQFGAPTFSPGL